MAKNSITDYSKTASLNTDIQSVDIDEGCLPSGINNAIRELMTDLAEVNDGTVSLTSPSFSSVNVDGGTIDGAVIGGTTAAAGSFTSGSFTGNVSLGDNNKVILGAGSDLNLYHDGSDSIIEDTGTGDLIIKASTRIWMKGINDETLIRSTENSQISLYHNGAEKLSTLSNGIYIYGSITASSASINGELTADSYNETYNALSGTTPTVNCHDGNLFSLTTSGNTTFTFSNPPASGTGFGFTLKLVAGGTHTITYPASVDWAGGTAPDAPASGETDVLAFITHDGGTTWYGFRAGDAMA